jgi:hypothetical protein
MRPACSLALHVKLVGDGTQRRTAEADVLVTDARGVRRGVDVNYPVGGYCNAPSASALEVTDQALLRGEIASFHYVSTDVDRADPAFANTPRRS